MKRVLLIAIYVLVFWGVLPWALWGAGAEMDRVLAWSADPSWLALLPGLPGIALLAAGIVELWRGGGGLPVSALPPPKLARRGPYRIVRHPIYLGFNAAILGAALALGSPGLSLVAVAFLPVWVAYALVEERGLVRRFGQEYRRYQRRIGLFPRLDLSAVPRMAMNLGLFPIVIEGRERIPAGGAILVANHTCYADPVFVGIVTRRTVHFVTTAEAFRGGPMKWCCSRLATVPVRRYRADPTACREVLRLLSEGALVGIFPERERSVLGLYQGALPDVASILARIPVPVIPIGISGAYDVGPRWSDVLRRRPVRICVGTPIVFGSDPRHSIDDAIVALIRENPQRIHMDGLPREKLARALWRCPRCLDESGWNAAKLECTCGCRVVPTADGRFDDGSGARGFADVARPTWDAPERGPIVIHASGAADRSFYGPILPLEPLGEGELRLDRDGLSFRDLVVPLGTIRSISTERADTLQVATDRAMWQFRLHSGSVFRLHRALERWKAEIAERASA